MYMYFYITQQNRCLWFSLLYASLLHLKNLSATLDVPSLLTGNFLVTTYEEIVSFRPYILSPKLACSAYFDKIRH
jgi:hypothetical protein